MSLFWFIPSKFTISSLTYVADSKPCLDVEYKCIEDGSCIDKSRLCDAFPDCDNGSDEMACGK